MTYTIHISADNLTWDIIHKADEIGGMIEQVLDDTILTEWRLNKDDKGKFKCGTLYFRRKRT